MMKRLLVAVLAGLMMLGALPAQAGEAKIWVQNNNSEPIYNVYVARPGDANYGYGGDLLGNGVISPGDGTWVYPPSTRSCKYYVMVRLQDGRTSTGTGKLMSACGSNGSRFTLY